MSVPFCLECQRETNIKKNAMYLAEIYPPYQHNSEPDIDRIARMTSFDLYTCPTCGKEFVGGLAREPMNSDFNESLYLEASKDGLVRKIYLR